MAKISSTLSYPSIGTVVGTDYWVLTDAESDLATKSVSVNQVQNFLGLEGSAVSKVTVTSAQLLNLANVPVTLIAAPGTDKIIDIISFTTYSEFNTTAYDFGDDLAAKIDTTVFGKLTSTVTNTNGNIISKIFVTGGGASLLPNKPLQLDTTANPSQGDGTLRFNIFYRVLKAGNTF